MAVKFDIDEFEKRTLEKIRRQSAAPQLSPMQKLRANLDKGLAMRRRKPW